MSYQPFDSYAAAQRAITAVINSNGYASQADWLRLEKALDAYREEQAARFPQSSPEPLIASGPKTRRSRGDHQ